MSMDAQARPPAGAGATLWQRLLDAPPQFRLMARAHGEAADPKPTRTRKRKPNFVTQVKRAMAAGLNVRSASITADGVVVTFGEAPTTDGAVIETADELRKPI